MERFVVQGAGGRRMLSGDIPVRGAKNAALKALAAAPLFKNAVELANIPSIEDIARATDLLSSLGVRISSSGHRRYRLRAPTSARTSFPEDIAMKMRASIVFTGPVLARYGSVSFPHPGGCVIGARPIDLFLDGFRKMNARVHEHGGRYILHTPTGQLSGADIFLGKRSVTATETLMFAAVRARGKTVIRNAALEPEIAVLADFLNACGARIFGAGTSTITVRGGRLLDGSRAVYKTPPDRIEAGSFLLLGALAARDLTIHSCNPADFEALLERLERAGVWIERGANAVRVKGRRQPAMFRAVNIQTQEYPGFPTDLQAPMTVLLTQSSGEALVFETIFEGRLRYTDELVRMGADIRICDPHRVIVRGPTPLRGRKLESPDLRAGLAYIIAALVADGESVIHNVYNVDRGHEKIEDRLTKIGADIKRISHSPHSPNF